MGRQAAQLDYSPAFQFGHPLSFELANRIKDFAPQGLDHVFFCASGSEAADTALKMARAYWRLKGQAGKQLLVGREKGYHGVNFGGISVGGMVANRKLYGQGVAADHIPHTQPAAGTFAKGQPAEGGRALADRLLDVIALHDASNIAAVIVEPFSGSGGVVVPPVGYLQRLREICTQHDILLIFDEVITGFGRCGTRTGAEAFGVTPDLMTSLPSRSPMACSRWAAWWPARASTTPSWPLAGGLCSNCPRLHLQRPPGGLRRRAGRARPAGGGRRPGAREGAGAALRGRGAQPQGRPARAGCAQLRPAAAGITIEAAPGSRRSAPTRSPCTAGKRASTCATAATPSSWRPPFISEKAEIERLVSALGDALLAQTA